MPTPNEIAAQMIARCAAGFQNEHHWKGWLRKHLVEIKALPVPLRKQVMVAHEQATAIAFSQPRAK